MPDRREPIHARLLAPLALALFAVAFFAVVLSSDTGEVAESPSGAERTTTQPRAGARTATRPRRAVYRVKPGDTLGAIAERTGVTVERLQELNPDVDPQALIAGQRLRLRE